VHLFIIYLFIHCVVYRSGASVKTYITELEGTLRLYRHWRHRRYSTDVVMATTGDQRWRRCKKRHNLQI